ncbi:MAG: DUF5675 family protein, partial [bacterium]
MDERRIVVLTRYLFTPFGSFGDLDTGSYQCKTLERPPAELAADHPCIPPSAEGYDVDWTTWHPHHSPCYEIKNVPGRSAILIHSANIFEQLLGCIAPGGAVEEIALTWEGKAVKHLGVSGSKAALAALVADLKQ